MKSLLLEEADKAKPFLNDREKEKIIEVIEYNLPYMRETEIYDIIIEKLNNNDDYLTDRELHLIDATLLPLVSQSFNQPDFVKLQTIRFKILKEVLKRF